MLLDEDGAAFTVLNPLPVTNTTAGSEVAIRDEVSGDTADVDWDSTYNALTVMDSRVKVEVEDGNIAKDQVLTFGFNLNYAYDVTSTSWGRMILETDNDAIAPGQIPQLVNGLMYYFDDKTNVWQRWRGDAGSMWTTVIGLYTPTFDSVMDDTLDAVKTVNASELVDDTVFIPATDRGLAIGGIATSDSVNVNDFGVLRITTDRSLVTTINNVTYNTDDDSIPDSQETMTNLTLLYGYNGSEWERLITDGSGNLKISGDINTTSIPYGIRIDEASATVTYIGKAVPGTATSASTWQIQKIDTTSGTVITWADGNGDFDNEWDERAGYSYS